LKETISLILLLLHSNDFFDIMCMRETTFTFNMPLGKDSQMNMFKSARRGIAAMICVLGALGVQAVTITVDKVRQRWPWNNKVDITYTVAGDNLATHNSRVAITTVINGNAYVVYEGAPNENAGNGTYTVTWENPPPSVKADDCQMTAIYYSEPVPAGDDYMIVTLADGTIAYEGLGRPCEKFGSATGQEISNSRYAQRKYKTTHLVLRKIPAGVYTTGDEKFKDNIDRNTPKTWTTDRDFYVAIYPWTMFQYWEVLQANGATGDHNRITPIVGVAWVNDVRGKDDPFSRPEPRNTGRWPILEHLNYKTLTKSGISGFDLPTALMHEIAARAGTTTSFTWGNTYNNERKKYCVCAGSGPNESTGFTDVGTKYPNAWGLYDMVGLVWEWTLDSYESNKDIADHTDVFTPFYFENENAKCVRPCKWDANIDNVFYLARHSAINKGDARNDCGFRVAYIVPAR
jgi:formylglycine-generating enzyme required for sulfatase activity